MGKCIRQTMRLLQKRNVKVERKKAKPIKKLKRHKTQSQCVDCLDSDLDYWNHHNRDIVSNKNTVK